MPAENYEASPNKTQPARTGRGKGRRHPKTKAERIKRRGAVAAMVASGLDPAVIQQHMAEKHGLTKRATSRLISKTIKRWGQEEEAERPVLKQMAVKRLQSHIIGAKAKGQWGAVASLERLLAEVQGTKEPDRVDIRVDIELRENVAQVLTMMTPEALTDACDRALSYRPEPKLVLPEVAESTELEQPAAE